MRTHWRIFLRFALALAPLLIAATAGSAAEPLLEGTSPEQFEAAWKIDADVEGQPASEVLGKLAKEMGVRLEGAKDPVLAQTVTMALRGRSKLEGIEEICRKTGCYPVYSGGTVTLKKGTRAFQAVFAGPFIVEIEDLEQSPATATGTLELKICGLGLPPSVRYLMGRDIFTIEKVTDAAGQDLLDRDSIERIGRMEDDEQTPSAYVSHVTVPLKNLLRSVTAVKSLRAQLDVRVPREVVALKFAKLASGELCAGEGVQAVLGKVSGDDNPRLSFEVKGAGAGSAQLVGSDAGGRPLEVREHIVMGDAKSSSITVRFSKRPASGALRVPIIQEIRYDVHFEDVPLKPGTLERLPELKFPAHDAPVTVEFLGIAGEPKLPKVKTVKVRVINHSNKAVRRADLKLVYLDGTGKKLGEQRADRALSTAVRENSSAEVEVEAFFMPPGTQSVQVLPEKVSFADATSWKPGRKD